MSWMFHYNGPLKKKDVRLCLMCASEADENCAVKHGSVESGCPYCQAAVKGCPSHCGLRHALETAKIPEDVASFVLSKADAMGDNVYVHLVSSEATPESPTLLSMTIEATL